MLRFLLVTDEGSSAEATVLSASVRRHHPDAGITWLLTGARPTGRAGPWNAPGEECVEAHRRAIGSLRYCDVWMSLSPVAARWSAIPGVVASLLTGEEDTVVVLPSWAQVYGSLDELVVASGGAIALLPRRFDEGAGVCSGGWLPEMGVFGPGSTPFLRWWEDLAENVARRDGADAAWWRDPWGVFCESAPGLHGVGAGASRLSPATAAELRLSLADGSESPIVQVDGHDLTLAAYPGFDPHEPWWYAEPGAEPAALVSASPALRHLCRARAERLLAAGWRESVGERVVPGLPHTPGLAAAYREALAGAVAGAPIPPNPFVVGEAGAYLDWMAEAVPTGPTGRSRAVDVLWADRPDLAQVFPNVRWSHREAFERWLWTDGLTEGASDVALLDPPSAALEPVLTLSDRPVRSGINLVGYHDAELGLGVVARRMGRALDAAGVPWSEVVYDRTSSRQRDPGNDRRSAPYSTHLVIVTADQLPLLAGDVGPGFFEGRHTIGMWFWETDAMPTSHQRSFDLVDELWAATTYLRSVFERYTRKPVTTIPVPLEFATPPSRDAARRAVGFDDRFTFLFSFDFLSVSERKNPLGLVEAYTRAFPELGRSRLVLKSINGELFPRDKERILDAIADRPDVELWDRYLDAPERMALVAAADCYVSLHRSEGLGLTMAEAMAAGTPVIASAYSGNLDFMDDNSALMVSGREVEIGEGSFYPADGHWFDPDLAEAARLMRAVQEDRTLRERLAAAGPNAVARFGSERVGAAIALRLRDLWGAEAP